MLRSTRYGMLHNDREALHNIIQELGSEPGIQRIRIFNQEGRVTAQVARDRARSCNSRHRAAPRRRPRAHFPRSAAASGCWR